nr:hypothetical protein [Naumannella cuiyingiana]
MITEATAKALSEAGLLWQPAAGDRFAIRSAELTGDVFWISELTIELHSYHDQSVLGFNGTTEWALDSIPLDRAVWLPREDQLRELLGERLVSLRRVAGEWEVATSHGRYRHADAEEAYARALLAAL